jgi:hypothetical protein
MHGSYAANMGLTETDLIIALGTRFDDRVTGRLSTFAPHARVIHVDIDPSEIGKIRVPDLPIVGDVRRVLEKLNTALAETAPSMAENSAAARRAWWLRSAGGRSSTPARDFFLRDRRSTWWPRSTRSPAARPLSVPTWASTRCGARSSSALTNRGSGSTGGLVDGLGLPHD